MTQPPPIKPQEKKELGDLGAPQVVFDTVAGPNLRLRDNLLQLVCCLIGGVLGAIIACFVDRSFFSILIGVMCGFVAGGVLSGFYLMIYRFVTGVKRGINKLPK